MTKIDYEDYTMIETENAGWHFNGEWEDEVPKNKFSRFEEVKKKPVMINY